MTLVFLSIVFSLIVMSLSDRINTIYFFVFCLFTKNQMHKLLKQTFAATKSAWKGQTVRRLVNYWAGMTFLEYNSLGGCSYQSVSPTGMSRESTVWFYPFTQLPQWTGFSSASPPTWQRPEVARPPWWPTLLTQPALKNNNQAPVKLDGD